MNQIHDVNGLASRLSGLGNLAIYLLTAVAVVFIVWNVVWYLIRDSEEGRKKAGGHILWGIVGLFVIISIWGLVNILLGTFVTNNGAPTDRLPNADFINPQSQNSSQNVNSAIEGSFKGPVLDAPSNSVCKNDGTC